MDQYGKEMIELRVEACKKALEANHIKAFVVDCKEEAKDMVDRMIQDHEQVCDGGSMSLIEAGILSMLEARDIKFQSHNDLSMTREESDAEARKAFYADTFVASSNAITLQGDIINVDGHGNRVSAMIFGPKQVILVVGYNKIVDDEAAAIQRIRSIAAPINCMRLQKQTPCRIIGACRDCKSMDRICCSHVKINFDREDRIRVILVKEELGY